MKSITMGSLTFLALVLISVSGCRVSFSPCGTCYTDVYDDGGYYGDDGTWYDDGGWYDNGGYYNDGGYNNGGYYNNQGNTGNGGYYNNGGYSNNSGGGWNNGGSNNWGSNNGSSNGGYNSGNNWGNGTSDDGNGGESLDLIGTVAARKDSDIKKAGKKFADRYALSEDAGVHVARTLDAWQSLGHQRARTTKDMADFTQRLYGISADQAKTALVKAQGGDQSALEESTQDIAQHWGTSPQTARTILKTWFKDQLGAVNVAK